MQYDDVAVPQSWPIASLAKSLAAAQAEMQPAKFDSVNPYFKSKFASLRAVTEAARTAARHGIGYVQTMEFSDLGIRCVTILMHESGEHVSSFSPWFRPSKEDAQGTAGATTYARRIGLSIAFGISADEDDDGNSAVEAPEARQVSRPQPNPDLVSLARHAAAKGIDSYGDFFRQLTNEQRRQILPLHEGFKEQAIAADHA